LINAVLPTPLQKKKGEIEFLERNEFNPNFNLQVTSEKDFDKQIILRWFNHSCHRWRIQVSVGCDLSGSHKSAECA
jgi:hypothetical protein